MPTQPTAKNPLAGIEELRTTVQAMNYCREDFFDNRSAEDILQIRRMWLASKYDIFPDMWTERQVKEALTGKPPQWSDDGRPVYDTAAEEDALAECPRCHGTMPAGPDAECPSEKCKAFLAWAAAQPQEEPES